MPDETDLQRKKYHDGHYSFGGKEKELLKVCFFISKSSRRI